MPELEQFIPVQLKTEETQGRFSFCRVFKHLLLAVRICNGSYKALLEKRLKMLPAAILLAWFAGDIPVLFQKSVRAWNLLAASHWIFSRQRAGF